MNAFKIARVWGIPISVHVTLVIVLPIIALSIARGTGISFLWGLAGAVGFFASVVLHELGHSLVALRKGCRVREIMLLPIGGVAQLDRMPTRPLDEFHVAIAGPVVSLGLYVAGRLLASLAAGIGLHSAARVLAILSSVNLMLALFNLLPSFPMDGGRIFRAWLTPKLGRLLATQIASGVGRFMALVFGIIALFQFNPFLLLIALFIYQAAGAEYRMVRLQEAARTWNPQPWSTAEPAWPGSDEEITVSPPPYARRHTSAHITRPLQAQQEWFDNLFEKWR
ncbi:MAG: site-2 protease family protein [Verrucomicrobia bacterium]|nr:site-2 protease family protein [Verrucomicrobiota bacterium]